MAIGKIDEKYFLSPLEAIELVGPETYGDEWRQGLPVNDLMMKGALHNLYTALQSGSVLAVHHCGDGNETPLPPIEAAHEFFKIDLASNACFPRGYSTPFALKIDRAGLLAYLKRHRPVMGRATLADNSRCRQWLVDLIEAGTELKPNKRLFEDASARFPGLSYRAFLKARARAIEHTRREDLAKGGRPRGTTKTKAPH
ncbi:MAG: hypothetical protein QM651_01120 [Rhodoblastus sp.]